VCCQRDAKHPLLQISREGERAACVSRLIGCSPVIYCRAAPGHPTACIARVLPKPRSHCHATRQLRAYATPRLSCSIPRLINPSADNSSIATDVPAPPAGTTGTNVRTDSAIR